MSSKSGSDGPSKLHTGCGYVAVVTLVACVLLVINSFMVHAALSAYQEVAPPEMSEPRAQQAIQIVLPVILIFMEYWLYDRLVDRLAKREGESTPSKWKVIFAWDVSWGQSPPSPSCTGREPLATRSQTD